MKEEKERLQQIAQDSWYNKGVNYEAIKYCLNVFKRFCKKGSLLKLGPAEGVMTEELYNLYSDYTIVEGSEYFCSQLKNKFPRIKIYNSLFENFRPKKNLIILY